jgi:hypothetical protein
MGGRIVYTIERGGKKREWMNVFILMRGGGESV